MTSALSSPPAGFDHYWSDVLTELDELPTPPEVTILPMRSSEVATVYSVYLTSIGPYRLFAYYSVPEGEGPFPVIYHTPDYGSVTMLAPYEERRRYVTLSLCHRGQRLADQPFAAAYPGLLTHGSEDPARYIFRAIAADCCRGVDFLLSRPEVDTGRIAVVGNDLALLTAALRPPASPSGRHVDAVYCAPALFYAARELAGRTDAYPLEEYNDFARAHPDRADAMWRTLAYFDPLHFAPKVRARVLLVSGTENDLLSPAMLEPLAASLAGPVEEYQTAHSSYKDGVHQETWLRQRYGFTEPLLPPHWR